MIYSVRMRAKITETQGLWALIAVMIAIDALWAWSLGIRIVVTPIVVLVFCLIGGIALAYATIRPNRRIAELAATVSQFIAFTAAAVNLSYLTVTSRFPLIDRYLAAADAAVGFDWVSVFMWVQSHPIIGLALALCYN